MEEPEETSAAGGGTTAACQKSVSHLTVPIIWSHCKDKPRLANCKQRSTPIVKSLCLPDAGAGVLESCVLLYDAYLQDDIRAICPSLSHQP